MQTEGRSDRCLVNTKRYADTYLRYYRQALEARLREAKISVSASRRYSPLVVGHFDKDFSLHVLFEPFSTWIVFSTVCPGRCVEIADSSLDKDWQVLEPHDAKERRILKLLGIPSDTVLTVDRYERPVFFADAHARDIEEVAKSYAIVQAAADTDRIRAWSEGAAKREEWARVVRRVLETIEAAGSSEAGVQFQNNLTRVLQIAGCEPRDVKTVGQQIDASCWISGHPVLIEMLNSRHSAEAKEVGDLFRKLATRPAGVIGILCAPGGFTEGARQEAKSLANQRTVLLWGRAEVERLLKSPSEICNLLLERYRDFIDRAGAQGS